MSLFSFAIPQNITFGSGALDKIPEAVSGMKVTKAFIVSGPHLNKTGLVDLVASKLKEAVRALLKRRETRLPVPLKRPLQSFHQAVPI